MKNREAMKKINCCWCRGTELYGIWAKRHGMSYNQIMVLYALNEQEPTTQKQIAENWLIPKQTVNTIVKELEKKDYVQFSDENSKRNREICFTEVGKKFADQMLKELYEIEERTLESLGKDRIQLFVELNELFTENFAREVNCE